MILRLHLNLAMGSFTLIIALKLQLKLVHHLIFFYLLDMGITCPLFLACETLTIIITIHGHEQIQVAQFPGPTLPLSLTLSLHLEARLLLLLLQSLLPTLIAAIIMFSKAVPEEVETAVSLLCCAGSGSATDTANRDIHTGLRPYGLVTSEGHRFTVSRY